MKNGLNMKLDDCRTIVVKNTYTWHQIVSGLQMTDVELDARNMALEENGGGNSGNGKKWYENRNLIVVLVQQLNINICTKFYAELNIPASLSYKL